MNEATLQEKHFNTVLLEELAKEISHHLKANGFHLDCFSYRKNGASSGIATEDCDLAIDLKEVPGDRTLASIKEAWKEVKQIWSENAGYDSLQRIKINI